MVLTLCFFQLYKIKVSHLKLSNVNKGEVHGSQESRFSHNNCDKTQKLILVNCNLRESVTGENKTDIISNPHDHLCTVRWIKYRIKYNLPPYWQGLVFLRKSTTETLKKRKALGITCIVDSDPTSPTDSTPRGKVVPSFLSKRVRKLAIMSKFDNAEKFTDCSARRGRFSKMATSGVAGREILQHARHKSVRTNTVYQSRNTSTSDHRNSSFMIGEKSTGTTSTTDYKPPYASPVQIPTFM
jgi:hypothetical protein